MELPKTLKIGGLIYQVLCDPQYQPYLDDESAWALSNRKFRKIYFDPLSDVAQRKSTLVHEVLHAARYLSGHELSDFSDEERIVKSLAISLYTIIVDNPDILHYLLANE